MVGDGGRDCASGNSLTSGAARRPTLDRGRASLSAFVLRLAVPVAVFPVGEGFVSPGAAWAGVAGRFVPVQSAGVWAGSWRWQSGQPVRCWPRGLLVRRHNMRGIGTPLFLSRSEAILFTTSIARKPRTTKATPQEVALLFPGRSRTTNLPTPCNLPSIRGASH
jgi:hypothetical protein